MTSRGNDSVAIPLLLLMPGGSGILLVILFFLFIGCTNLEEYSESNLLDGEGGIHDEWDDTD